MNFNTVKGGVFHSIRVVTGGMGSFRREGISGFLEGGDAGVGWDVDLLGKPLLGPACTPLLSALPREFGFLSQVEAVIWGPSNMSSALFS